MTSATPSEDAADFFYDAAQRQARQLALQCAATAFQGRATSVDDADMVLWTARRFEKYLMGEER